MQGNVKSARRVFEVLELYEQRRTPLSATDVGRALGYPSSSAAALLKCMMGLGYLTFDARHKHYLPSTRLSVLGRWIERSLFGETETPALLHELHRATGEAAVLSAQCDLHMVTLHIVARGEGGPDAVERGHALPLFRSAVGLAQLSSLPDFEVEMLRERADEHGGPSGSPGDPALLRRAVKQVRSRGYASELEPAEPGFGTLAIPVRTLQGGSQYVVSTLAPFARMRDCEVEIARGMREVLARHLVQRADSRESIG